MFLPQPNAREVSRQVARLPLDYFVCRSEEHWIVVGPTGIFVVGRSGEDPTASAELTVSLARRIRARLSDVIPWVPFVDPLLVAGKHLDLPCTVVDIHSLEMALLCGPVAIDEVGVDELRSHVPRVLLQIEAGAEPTSVLPIDPAGR